MCNCRTSWNTRESIVAINHTCVSFVIRASLSTAVYTDTNRVNTISTQHNSRSATEIKAVNMVKLLFRWIWPQGLTHNEIVRWTLLLQPLKAHLFTCRWSRDAEGWILTYCPMWFYLSLLLASHTNQKSSLAPLFTPDSRPEIGRDSCLVDSHTQYRRYLSM